MTAAREAITHARRIVIKVGTSVATAGDHAFAAGVIRPLVSQIAGLADGNARSFILVSSGAIALGLNRMRMSERPKGITLLQAAAAMGQSRLMQAYEIEFGQAGLETAQILLTYEDIRSRARYLNIRNTIFTLWSFGVVPIVNENDTVSFAEIRFGDNDIISAHLANMLDADLLVMLTDTDGLYDRNPRLDPQARILRTVEKVTDRELAGTHGKGSAFSSGGMESKIRAADIATRSGVGVVIAKGDGLDLAGILGGQEVGTWFVPAAAPHARTKEVDGVQPADGGIHPGGPRGGEGHPGAGPIPPAGRSESHPRELPHGERDLHPGRGGTRGCARAQQLLLRGAGSDQGPEHEQDRPGARGRGLLR